MTQDKIEREITDIASALVTASEGEGMNWKNASASLLSTLRQRESELAEAKKKLETMKSELSPWIDKCNTSDLENDRLRGTIRSLTETIEAHADRVEELKDELATQKGSER